MASSSSGKEIGFSPRQSGFDYQWWYQLFEKRSCLNMAYIYMIKNDINNKIYIGKTFNDVDKR